MPKSPSPNCGAKYEVVRVEAPQARTTDREITCISCGGPLFGREGPFLLKYFLVSVQNGARADGESVVSDTCAHDNENWPVIWIKNS